MRMTMKKLTQGATRLLVLALGLGLVSTVWATDYTYSNVDSDSLATTSDGANSAWDVPFNISSAASYCAASTFPTSGFVQLTSISIAARASNGDQTATTAKLTNNKTSETYTGTVTYVDDGFTADLPASASNRTWTRKEERITFATDGVLVDTTATYTLKFYNESGTQVKMGRSVVKSDSVDWTTAIRIYGRTPSGSMEMPSSLIPSSGGVSLPSTVTVADATGIAFANDSVTIGNSGIQVTLGSSISHPTIMVKAVVPSSSSRLIGWKVSDALEPYLSYTGSQFEQHFLNSGSIAGTTYGTSAWTRDSSEHWIAVSYASADNQSQQTSGGTRTYLDGTRKIENTLLKWKDNATSKVTIGGTAYNTTAPATGMVVKDFQIYNNALTDAQVTNVTVALNAGWTVDASGMTFTSTGTLHALPGYANVSAIGTVTMASDGTISDLSGLTAVQVGNGATLDLSANTGLTQVIVLSGGELTIGKQRPGSVAVESGGILNVSSIPTASECITGYIPTAELSVENSSDLTGTVKLEGETVTPSFEGTTATLTGTIAIAGNPTYTGYAWWWDYEFNESSSATIDGYHLTTPNEGNADDVALRLESSNADYTSADETGNRELYFQQTPWRNASFSTLSELTAVMYCAPGNYANTVLVAFGSTTASGKKAIALVTGATPAAGEMKLVLTDGVATKVTELADLTAVGATTTKHLYAFIMDRITENETEKTRVRVYLDGKVKAIYKHNGILTLSDGFQIGSLHGGVAPTGFNTGLTKYSSSGNSGTLDFLRVVDGKLTDDAMSALAEAYPYNSAYGEATRDPISSAANWVATDVWTQKVPNRSDATQDAPNADTNVKLSIDGSSAVSVALNLTTDSNYESLTLGKEAGATGSLNLTSGMGNSTAGKLVSAETSVLVDTTVPAGRVNLGVTSVADGITLTVDPYSPYGNTALAAKFNTMAFGDIYEDVIISMALLGDDAAVELDETYRSSWEDAGFTIELIYDSSNLSYTLRVTREAATADIRVEIAAGGTVTWSTRTIPVPAPESLPDTYANTVTITNMTESAVTIATAFAGGNVTVASGGPVTLTGAISTPGTVSLNSATTLSGNTVSSALTGSGAVTISGTVTLDGSIANTINGSGTLVLSTIPKTLSFGEWTGTVVLPADQTFGGQKFDDYGIAGSTVRLQGANTGWLDYGAANNTPSRAPVATTIEIPSGASLTVTGWSSSFANTFNVLKGSGTFAVNIVSAIDISYSDYSAYFLLKDVSNFTGSLSATGAGIAIGASKPAHSTTGGKIILTTSATIATGKTWTATEGIVLADADATLTNADGALDPAPTTTVANSYVKRTGSIYSVDGYNTVAFTVANATVTRTDVLGNAIKDGDTVTFTVAPDANYGVSSVTATSGDVTNDGGTYSYVVTSDATITIEIVRTHVQLTIPAVDHATAAVTVGAEAAAGSSPYTVPYQSNVTVTWTPASGYKITAGASQTINSIAADTTAEPPTVEAKGATVSGVTFDYGADFATATVTATVSGDATAYTLTVGTTDYPGVVDGSTVTFSGVATGHAAAYDNVGYTIAATDGTSPVTVSGGSGAAPVADVTADWINERAASATGTSASAEGAGGTWTNAVTYTDGKATISDNRFVATEASTASRVVLEFNVCFSSTSEEDVSGEAQAAIKLAEVDSVTTFMVLTNGNEWAAVSNAGLTPDASATYKVVLTIDYGSNAYGVTVGNYVLTNSTGSASFPLAASRTSVQNIDFAGSGTLTSMKGDQVEGYMVKDNAGHWYATIEAATQAYNSANGPYTVLHNGTPPSGWKIVEGALIKVAKGLFFMAY